LPPPERDRPRPQLRPGTGILAEAVAASGAASAPTLPAGAYPFTFINAYSKTVSGATAYSGTAANWVRPLSSLIGPSCQGPAGMTGGSPSSIARSVIVFDATTTPTGLSGTIAFVTQFAAIELQALPTVCWWEPMAEVRRIFTFTAVPEP